MALNLHLSYMVTRAISVPAWIHQLEEQGRDMGDMAPSAKHTFFTLFGFFPSPALSSTLNESTWLLAWFGEW